MSEPDESLPQSLEQRNVISNQDHFRHYKNLRVSSDRERKLIEPVTSI